VVIDPHNFGATTTAGQASIRLYRDPALAAAVFEIPFDFPFASGCDLNLTDARFLNKPLIDWIPEAVLNQLFVTLKNPRIRGTKEPVITHIESDACTPDPANPTTGEGAPGILSFQADVRFRLPK
jgi:hypothetical protein